MSITIPSGASAIAAGLSGMRAAQLDLDTRAHNIANVQTPGFQRQTVTQTAQAGLGGVNADVRQKTAAIEAGEGMGSLIDDVVGERMSLYTFEANLQTVKTQDRILGTLLDTTA